MRMAQLLVYETDGRLAALLRPLAELRGWSLREPRQLDACLALLERGGPAVVVIKAGRDLEQEFGLIERVRWLHPAVGVILVGDSDHARLVGLAWDLGASWVHLPPRPREELVALVDHWLSAPPDEDRP